MKDQVSPLARRASAWVLPLFFLIVFGGAIVLGPLLYFALHPVRPQPFHRVMDRAFLISAVAALLVFWRRLDLPAWWPPGPRAVRHVLFG
jgi:hypothetical protein